MKDGEDLFSIGLQYGYTSRLMKQQWKSSAGEKLDGLNMPGGMYAGVMIGVRM